MALYLATYLYYFCRLFQTMAGTPFSWAPTVDVWREHENALCLLDDPTFLLFAGNRKPWTTLAPEMHRALREPAEKLSSGQLSSMFTLNYKNSAKNSERWLRIMELVTTMRTEKRIRGAARLFTQCPIFHPPPKRKKKFHAPGTVIFTNTCRFCVQGLVCLVSVMPYSSSESASRSEAPSSSSSSPPQSRTCSWYVLFSFLQYVHTNTFSQYSQSSQPLVWRPECPQAQQT